MTHQQQQNEEEARDDIFEALSRISNGVGTGEDAECLNIDPQALKVFYEWSEQNAK